ncbi:MAG: toprim protein, partial [Verrucomicrobiales bacterium]|nr:toprim protein [Verrucomicrobiales bacterium]
AYPVKNLHGADEYLDDVLALYNGGRKPGYNTGWPTLDEFMTIRQGELSVVTGIPSSGKSEFVDALCMNLAMGHGWRFGVCSFENPPDEHLAKLAEKKIGMPFFQGPLPRMSEDMVRGAVDWLRERFFLIRADDDAPTIEMILTAARAGVIRHGINGLVIDPYNEIEHTFGAGTETQYISAMLAKVRRFAQNHSVHVWFVAHPQKPSRNKDGEYPELTLYDIAGGAHWANKADLGIVVSRDYTDGSKLVTIKVKKVRFKAVGKPGEVMLEFDRATGAYTELVQRPMRPRYSADE